MATRVQLYGCMNCFVSGNTDRVVLINCSGLNVPASSGVTYIQNGRHIPNLFTNATASAPTYVTGDHIVYKGDCSGGDAYFEFDTVKLRGCAVTIKCVGAGNDFIISTKSTTGLFETSATPYTLTPLLLESFTIWCDGTDLFII